MKLSKITKKSEEKQLLPPTLPLPIQIAKKIIKENHIYIVRYEGEKTRIPFIFDGKRYKEDDDLFVLKNLVKEYIVDVFSHNMDIIIPDKVEKQYYSNAGFVPNLIKVITGIILDDAEIQKESLDFDQDDFIINTQSGVLDFRTMELKPHSPKYLIRNITNCCYLTEEIEEPSLYIDFVRSSIYDKTKTPDENVAILESLLEQYAYSLTGDTSKKYVMIGAGPTNTGKSTEVNLRKKMLGSYIATIPTKGLMKTRNSDEDKRPDVIACLGARQVIAIESDEKDVYDGSLLKRLAGNDEVSLRKLYKNMIHFVPRFKIHLFSNFFPEISNIDDTALIKRLHFVQYRNTVPDEAIDPDLSKKLQDQDMMDRIFTYLARKAHNFYKNGKTINIHSAFFCDKEKILLNQKNSISLFLSSGEIEIKPLNVPSMHQKKYSCSYIYQEIFCDYCKNIGIEASSWTAFGKQFKDFCESYPGVKKHPCGNKWYYTGLEFPNYPDDPTYSFNKVDDEIEKNSYQLFSKEVSEMVKKGFQMKTMMDLLGYSK